MKLFKEKATVDDVAECVKELEDKIIRLEIRLKKVEDKKATIVNKVKKNREEIRKELSEMSYHELIDIMLIASKELLKKSKKLKVTI